MKSRRHEWQVRPRWRAVRAAQIALGPGKVDLLEAIDRTGAISSAARSMGMSYRRAWLLVETMNRCFTQPLVATSRWRGRGARLTPEGRRVLRLYRRIESTSLAAARKTVAELKQMLRPAAGTLRRS